MFRSIWFWVIVILVGLALWFGRDQIAFYFDKLPMTAQERTTNTQTLASSSSLTSHPTARATTVATALIASSVQNSSPTGGTIRPTPRPAATLSPRFTTYVVKKGDTLYSISKRYHTTVEKLTRINHISDPTTLSVGQELKIPLPPAAAKPTRPVPVAGSKTYTVQKGDTLSSIARKFNTSVATLQKLNHFANPNKLAVGSVILVPATTKAKPTTVHHPSTPPPSSPSAPSPPPSSPVSGDEEVHALPVLSTPSSAGSAATVQPTAPAATPTPSPIPTMPSVCDGAQEAVFVWGVSFCIPSGWDLQEYADPHRPALLSKKENGGDLSIYAISRLDGSPNAPLSWSMRQAKKAVSSEISSLIPGGLATPEEWSLATGLSIADVEGQTSEARTTYLGTGHAARVRVVVFNHGDQRWRIIIVAPDNLWQEYNVSVFPYIVRTMEVF
jgi:LysM repeat protein